MKIIVKRKYFRDSYTIGVLQVENPETGKFEYFCDTLEPRRIDWTREKKVAGRTAIPEGCYRVDLSYSRTYKRQMPYLLNVPNFTGIMIHTGNSAKDTRGCILVGRNTIVGKVTESRTSFQKLFRMIKEAIEDGEDVWVKVYAHAVKTTQA